jgi:hypothetical protein
MLSYTTFLFYKVYFGEAAKVLSESMGAEEYKTYISESIGKPAVLLMFSTLLSFAVSMILLIKEKYSLANIFLIASLVSLVGQITNSAIKLEVHKNLEHLDHIQTAISTTVITVIFAALFWYSHKYLKLSKS